MSWSVYLIRTVTGEVGSRLDPVSASWSIELNKVESGSVKVRKEDILKYDKLWWAPHSGGIMMTYTTPDGNERPIVAGPITGWPTETEDEIELSWSGIRWIFTKRVIDQTLEYQGPSLGNIGWNIVENTMSQKPGGLLPIYHASPDEEVGRQRTYEDWNLSNNGVDKRLTELSEVINGPDIMFRPEWKEFPRTIQWGFYHGTEYNTVIEQQYIPDFDSTTPQTNVNSVSVKSAADHIADRVWCTGSGEGEGVARVSRTSLDRVQKGFPFLEKVISDSDQSKEDQLAGKAEGELAASRDMLDQVTISYQSDSKNPIGTFFVGNVALVTLKGFISVPDGSRNMRIIKMNGDLTNSVTLDFQEASW